MFANEGVIVILSGSLTLQAALGVRWQGSDVDIFCTWAEAPKVRQRLIEKCNLICSGANDTYFAPDEKDLSVIDHVEGFAPRPAVGHHALARYGGRDPLSLEEFCEQAAEYGRIAVASTPRRGMFGLLPEKRVGFPDGCGAGRPFLYDRDLERSTVAQLIIGKKTCLNARELLANFDLVACQTYFDGQGFSIPSPCETLWAQTRCIPPRRAVVDDFVRSYWTLALAAGPSGSFQIDDIPRNMPSATWAGVMQTQPKDDDNVMFEWFSRYNFATALVSRLQKYCRRGITILDAPAGALSFQTQVNFRGDWCDNGEPPRSRQEDPPPFD